MVSPVAHLDADPSAYTATALAVFRHQARHNALYAAWLAGLRVDPAAVRDPDAIPALPIRMFREHAVVTFPAPFPEAGTAEAADRPLCFTSSGSTAATASRHWIPRPAAYREAFTTGFRRAYGPPADWTFCSLLPAYLEREGSGLVYMADRLTRAGAEGGGFFLHDHGALLERLRRLRDAGRRVLLLGVGFALLDLAESGPHDLAGVTVVETGGMKGRRREPVREELHEALRAGLGVADIHGEYGMTELCSQAWSPGGGRYRCPPWMRVRIRPLHDPLGDPVTGTVGRVEVQDLANGHSVAFIATDDLGRAHPDGSFEILGRYDHADLRGCNLLVA